MATCVIPWTRDYSFDEQAFRRQVRDQAQALTKHLYIFGTAGEGYAVTDAQFALIARVFAEEARACGVEATLGIIHLSLGTIVSRIEFGRTLGIRRFQISLPAWGALNDRELDSFFQATCGRFPDCTFMHYNLPRTKRVLTGDDYERLAAAHPNLVATKNSRDEEAFLAGLFEKAPQLQHFLGERGYVRMRDRHTCGLLISGASTNPARAQAFFGARGSTLAAMGEELRGAHAALHQAVGTGPHMDGVFDKLLYKLRAPDFPLRLLPPYETIDDAAFERYQEAMKQAAPMWLPVTTHAAPA